MKRWLIAPLLLIIPDLALANWLYLPGPGYSRAVSEGACSETPYATVSGTPGSGFNLGSTSALVYIGQAIATGQTSHNLCGVKFQVRGIVGTITTKSYHAEVWSTTNGDRTSVKATSNSISGATFSAGQLTGLFSFSPSVSLGPTDAVVITEEGSIDGVNYAQFGYINADSDSGYSSSAIYNSSGVDTPYATRDILYELYQTN